MILGAGLGWLLSTVSGAACPPQRSPFVPQVTQPFNLDLVKATLRDYHAHVYHSHVAATLGDARNFLRQRMKDKAVVKPALVLDIDETALSNWPNLAVNDFGFIADGPCAASGACGFNAWVDLRLATAIVPTLELFNEAKALGVAVFFVNARRESQRAVTAANLTHEGYQDWARLVLRADSDKDPSVQPFKTGARAEIESEGFTILANVGDQESDLAGGHAECGFKVTNPFYLIK